MPVAEGTSTGLLASVLSVIELRELGLLAWGAHSARFSREELEAVVADAASAADPSTLIDALVAHALVFEVPGGGYRSRMAETVRILATLRQSFPNRPWTQAPELVLDYRVLHRPRRRPSRSEEHRHSLQQAATDGLTETAAQAVSSICPAEVSGFQLRSSQSIRLALAEDRDTGVVISASTGGGKTLAAFLPAIAWIVDAVSRDPSAKVAMLALYPRNELLKDQLRTALAHTLALSAAEVLPRRPLRLGAWFGAVPRNAYFVSQGWSSWELVGPKANPTGWRCPYLDCLRCGSHLVWPAADVSANLERLRCVNPTCDFGVEPERIALTRESAIARPPDIMFTTTESLNRQLADPDAYPAFGLAGDDRVRMVLLDEVHTYEGVSGAQNAYLLRRLRHTIGRRRPLLWAGLSATLLHAQQFFADFTGTPSQDVVVVEPYADELEESSAEYLLALRHNPGSSTGPLSATIQTAMALQRSLDVLPGETLNPFALTPPNAGGLFGSRTFVFTDKLDVTNRLYWDLLDAEGWWDEQRPRANRIPTTLAHLRSANQGRLAEAQRVAKEARLEAGQWWWMAETLGHQVDADMPLRIGRTSSQDQGVSNADVIVATATLEVGYDDERVGAVIQHKAPHDAARFLQRKGRAGRSMEMRPWTAVVLSSWGRDRLAWQAYDQLFDPQLEATRLPLANRYVQRMQAVYALLDWISNRVRLKLPDRNVWTDLAGPAAVVERRDQRARLRRERQDAVEQLLKEVLDGGPARSGLNDHLSRSLRLSADELGAVLWSPPRSLMLAVIPTAYRRLHEQWDGETPTADDQRVRTRTPLTEFIAGNLFDDLLTPESLVALPTASPGRSDVSETSLPVLRVLREFMPGNVTRHFGVRTFDRRHWVPLPDPDDDGRRLLSVDAYGGEFVRHVGPDGDEVPMFRPGRVQLEVPPDDVYDSTTSSPVWEVSLEALGTGSVYELPAQWAELFAEVRFHMHAEGDGVRICRYARRAVGVLRSKHHQQLTAVDLTADPGSGSPAAIGTEFEADGIAITVAVPPPMPAPTPLERSLRLADHIQSNTELKHLNSLTRSALVNAALLVIIEQGGAAAATSLSDRRLADALEDCLDRLGMLSEQRGTANSGNPPVLAHEQIRDLRDVIRDESVLAAIRTAARAADLPERDQAWLAWHRRRIGTAAGELVVDAASRMSATFDPDEVTIDLVPNDDPTSPTIVVWITEQGPGGNGLIETLRAAIAHSPAEFRRLLLQAAQPTELQRLDKELEQFVSTASSSIDDALNALRTSWEHDHETVETAIHELRQEAARDGLDLSRAATTFVTTRLAGPGSPTGLRVGIHRLLQRWRDLEATAGFAIDPQLFGAACASDTSLDVLPPGTPTNDRTRARAIAGLFWPRSLDSASTGHAPGGLFGLLPTASPDLLAPIVPSPWPLVDCAAAADARDAVAEGLVQHGAIALRFPDRSTARSAILAALEEPIEAGALFIYPRVDGIESAPEGIEVLFTAAELGT